MTTESEQRIDAIKDCAYGFHEALSKIRMTENERDEIESYFDQISTLAENYAQSLTVYEEI